MEEHRRGVAKEKKFRLTDRLPDMFDHMENSIQKSITIVWKMNEELMIDIYKRQQTNKNQGSF